MISLGPDFDTSPLLCNPFDIFRFSFSGTYSSITALLVLLKFIASHDLFTVRYSTKFCPGPTWTNPYLMIVEGSLMKLLMKKRLNHVAISHSDWP